MPPITYTRDTISLQHSHQLRPWLVYGDMWDYTDRCGLYCLHLFDSLNGGIAGIEWFVATISDAYYIHTSIIAEREWLSYGAFWMNDTPTGISCLNDYGWPGYFLLDLATIIYS